MLDTLFLYVLDMTVKGSLVILAVLLIRLCLRKAPKVFSYALWGVVLLRLLCPFSIQLPVSMLPQMESVPQTYRFESDPVTITDAGSAVNRVMEEASAGTLNTQQIYVDVPSSLGGSRAMAATLWEICVMAGQYLWLLGVCVMVACSLIHYMLLRRRLIGAMRLQDNIWLADHIDSPFVMGFFKPKIYLPSSLADGELGYIIAHEKYHIRRRDPVVKLLGFVALSLHWFNPLVWLAYVLFCKDMEMSCDEAVIQKLGADIRADYAASLLHLATGRRIAAFTPLAFGEGDTKSRIKNLAKWKKPVAWIATVCILVCVAAAVCLLTDPTPKADNVMDTTTQTDKPQPGGTDPSEAFEITLSHAGYTEETALYAAALNTETFTVSSVQHLPVYKFETRSQLDDFVGNYGKFLSLNQSYDEVPSFYGVSERYDQKFFEEKTLILVYITAGSGSYRYGADSIYCSGNTFVIHVKKTKDPQVYTADMAGWFLCVSVPRSMLNGVTNYDADLGNLQDSSVPYLAGTEISGTKVVLNIKSKISGTDFSMLSSQVRDAVESQWRTYDNLTPWQRSLSSQLFGLATFRFDSWTEAENALGLRVENPLKKISWLEVTDVYGGIATDTSIRHVELTVDATDMETRAVQQVNMTAGYRTDGIRVILNTTMTDHTTVYGYSTLRADGTAVSYEYQTTGSGYEALVMPVNREEKYAEVSATWCVRNVHYILRLVADKGDEARLEPLLKQLLGEI